MDESLLFWAIVKNTQLLWMDSRSLVHLNRTLFMKPIYLKSKPYLIVHIIAGNDLHINVNHPDYLTHHVSDRNE